MQKNEDDLLILSVNGGGMVMKNALNLILVIVILIQAPIVSDSLESDDTYDLPSELRELAIANGLAEVCIDSTISLNEFVFLGDKKKHGPSDARLK